MNTEECEKAQKDGTWLVYLGFFAKINNKCHGYPDYWDVTCAHGRYRKALARHLRLATAQELLVMEED